jgi:hypothetical protein
MFIQSRDITRKISMTSVWQKSERYTEICVMRHAVFTPFTEYGDSIIEESMGRVLSLTDMSSPY